MTSIHARSNTHLIFPPVTSTLSGASTLTTAPEEQEGSIGAIPARSTPEIITQGVKRKLTVEFEGSCSGRGSDPQDGTSTRTGPLPPPLRYPVSSGASTTALQTTLQPSPLPPPPSPHGVGSSAINPKGHCLQEKQIKSLQLDFRGSHIKGSSVGGGATSQTVLFQSTSSLQQSSTGNQTLISTGPSILSSGISNMISVIHLTTLSNINDSMGQTTASMSGSSIGSGGSSSKDPVGIITAVDRKRALRRL